MNFKCPECDWNVLEEIIVNCTVAQEVTAVYPIYLSENPSLGVIGSELEYGDQETTCGDIERYQCQGCGWILPDIITEEELYEFLLKGENDEQEN